MTAQAPKPYKTFDVDALLTTAEIIVCCGSGGVGKTTTAAALALRAAELGRRTVVLTIDPARRLAQSMGLTALDNTPRRVSGVDESAGGELHAMISAVVSRASTSKVLYGFGAWAVTRDPGR